jgi:hypothetical protein
LNFKWQHKGIEMPECYLLAVCQASSLDQYENNWSLFTLIEACQIGVDATPTPEKPVVLPFQVHAYWYFKPEDIGSEFEWRLVTVTGQQSLPHTDVFRVKADKQRTRGRVEGFRAVAVGASTLNAEWRKKGTDVWTLSRAFWPIDVEFSPKKTPQPSLPLPEG